MERFKFSDPSRVYERNESKVRYAARKIYKLKKDEREAAVKLFIPEQYQDWVLKQIKQLERR